MRVRTFVLGAVSLGVLTVAAWIFLELDRVSCRPLMVTMKADGRFQPVGMLRRMTWRTVHPEDVTVRGADPARIAIEPQPSGAVFVLYRAPLSGVDAELRPRYGSQQWTLPVHVEADLEDGVGDGLPDALRLHDPEDRLRFRRWFTALADQAASLPDRDLPPEITDCSALLRYGYRIALVRHDDRWYKQFAPGTVPVLPSVEQWNYPETPLRAGLFRVTQPTATPQAGDFAQFADAKTLYRLNSFRVGRDVRLARPGDLLFFHQLEHGQQYHSMIVTGEDGEWVVYHTGPDGSGKTRSRGEMRRARVSELLQHPDASWHPTSSNSNFLGVYRWNLLRED